MRTHEEVLEEARRLVYAEYEDRLINHSRRLPVNCLHNHRQPLDVRNLVLGARNPNYNRIAGTNQTLGLCMLTRAQREAGEPPEVRNKSVPDAEDWNGDICEDPIDAQKCSYFNPTWTRWLVWEALQKDLTSPEWVENHMPRLAALQWVLDQPVPLTWVQRLKLYFTARRPEPQVVSAPLLLEGPPRANFNSRTGSDPSEG